MALTKQKEHPSAARLCLLMAHLEREGEIRLREIAPLLHVSSVTASQYARMLQESGVAFLARSRVGCDPKDRKLRLTENVVFHVLSVEKTRLCTFRLCSATGKHERRTLSLCPAISDEEARLALLRRVSDAWEGCWQSSVTVGVMLEDGLSLPEGTPRSLLARRTDTWETLTVSALLREFGEQSVLYVRYSNRPLLILMAGGVRLPMDRPNQALARMWSDGAEERIDALAKQLSRIYSVFALDVVVVEADGVRAETVIESLHATAVIPSEAESTSAMRFVAVKEIGLAEREMLARLRLHLAEKLLSDAKK